MRALSFAFVTLMTICSGLAIAVKLIIASSLAERLSSSQSIAHRWGGTVSTHCWTGGFHNLAFCILIPISASTPDILGKSRMRKSARTDLCGGRPAMVVPTATIIPGVRCYWAFSDNAR